MIDRITRPLGDATRRDPEASTQLRVLTEEALRNRGPRLRFPEPLERRFRRDSGSRRARILRFLVAYGLAVDLALSVIVTLCSSAAHGWGFTALQDCGVIVVALLVVPYLRPGMAFWKREAAVFLLALAICVSANALACEQVPEDAAFRLATAVLPLSVILALARPAFPFGVLLVTLVNAAFDLGLAVEPHQPLVSRLLLAGLSLALAAPALYSLHRAEWVARQLYLSGVIQRLTYARLCAAKPPRADDLSTLDPLTGVSSRRRMEADLARICDQPDTRGSFLLVDIDWFKDLNDMFGHQTGDRCLQEIGNCLSATLRDGDLIARIGGEEFGILLPNLPLMDAVMVAERLRAAVACYPFMVGTRIAPVTVSIGVAGIVGYDEPERVMTAAEEAMFRAKRAGRNQVGTTGTTRGA